MIHFTDREHHQTEIKGIVCHIQLTFLGQVCMQSKHCLDGDFLLFIF